jgi:SAM-dependent methyltransferase
MGEEIARRAAGAILVEYRALRPRLAALAPARVADIGCGHAFFDLFLARDLGPELVLIDLEANDRRHFAVHPEGTACASLAVARRLLAADGVAPGRIVTPNPREADPAAAGAVDIAMSFLSCGFHSPVDQDLPFFRDRVRPGGAVILDLRGRTAEAQLATLAPLGRSVPLPSPPKARRILLSREGGGDAAA